MQDVQLLGSSDLRDVCVATATHLMTAFANDKPPPKPHFSQRSTSTERDGQVRVGGWVACIIVFVQADV